MTADLRGLIRGLNLGPEPVEPSQFDGLSSGAVVHGSLVAIGEGVTEEHRRDAFQCLLLAQLAANSNAERHRDPTNWQRSYFQTLSTIGWAAIANVPTTPYQSQGTPFTIATVVSDLFRPRVAAEYFSVVVSTLNAFRRDVGGQVVFECPSHSGGLGNFQFVLLTEEDADTAMLIARISFSTAAHVTRLAVEEFSTSATFNVGLTTLLLNEGVYRQVRSAVAQKVANRIAGAVVQLEMSPRG
jgi:hypothetical protein